MKAKMRIADASTASLREPQLLQLQGDLLERLTAVHREEHQEMAVRGSAMTTHVLRNYFVHEFNQLAVALSFWFTSCR